MSLKKSELIEKNQYELTFDVDRATFDKAVDKAYRRSVKNINIPGFRRGKAPRSIIEKMYGKEIFLEDAINELISSAYAEVMGSVEKTVVSRPEFDVVTIDENDIDVQEYGVK